MRYGVDVSHYQQKIQWSAVKEEGIEFAILKCMYESSRKPDEFFERNYKRCKKHGIDTGIYVFLASKSITDTDGEIKTVLDILKGRPLKYGIWLDLESDAIRKLGKNGIRKIADKEAEAFHNAGYNVGIYSNRHWYMNVLDGEWLKKYPFWCARYSLNDIGEPVEYLSPKDYAQGWQYSSKGTVKGIKGYVDRDIDFGTMI